MNTATSRRTLFGTTAAFAACAAGPAIASAPASTSKPASDDRLIALCAAFDACELEYEAIYGADRR